MKAALEALGLRLASAVGAYILRDRRFFVRPAKSPGVELLPLAEALSRYPELRERYYFKAVPPEAGERVRAAAGSEPRGYFLRVREGVRVAAPMQAAFLMETDGSTMNVHNIVVLEEGSRLHLMTGCLSGGSASCGLHASVAEQYVGAGATLVSTMIHEWGPEFSVLPTSATLVEDRGAYFSNYYSLKPSRRVESAPCIRLRGERATTRQTTVVVGLPGTRCELGGTIRMEGAGSSAELVSRTANYGGTVVQTGLLVGAGKDCRGHVDCSGLILGGGGTLEAVPGLRTEHPDARLSHEAAIGRVDRGEVQYLQSKGLDEAAATALIVRGFLDAGDDMEEFAPELRARIRDIIELSGHGE